MKIEFVFTASRNDLNQDHRIVYDATLVATRPRPGCPVKKVLAYEASPIVLYGEPSGGGVFRATVFVDTELYLKKKIDATRLDEDEVQAFPHPSSLGGLDLLARD